MCQDTNQIVVSNFRSGLEHCSLCGRVLSLDFTSLVEKFFRTMSASDSESNMSGADITITAVHPSPFRGPITGDEFDGQEISFEPSGEQGHSDVPGFVAFADHSYFKLVRYGSSRIQFASLVYRLSGSEIGEETSTTPSSVLAQDSADEQEDIGILSLYSEPASSAYPAVKTLGSSPRSEDYGSPRGKTPRFQKPKDQLARKSEPFAGPRQASDPRLLRAASVWKPSILSREMPSAGPSMSVKRTWLASITKITSRPLRSWSGHFWRISCRHIQVSKKLCFRMRPIWNPNNPYFGSIIFVSLSIPRLTTLRYIGTRSSLHMVLTLQVPRES